MRLVYLTIGFKMCIRDSFRGGRFFDFLMKTSKGMMIPMFKDTFHPFSY